MTRGKNFSLTKNNPDEALEEFHSVLKRDAVYARAQLERGEEGTPHFQACVGYSKTTRLNAVIKRFPGCHVELSKNAMAAYAYCGKSDTRLEGPLDHGVPPASLRVKGDKKERNKLILQYGVVKAVDEGLIDIEKVK